MITGTDDLAAIELRAVRSAWRALAKRWGLTARELADLLPAGGEDADSPPRDTETRMRILIEIGYRIGLREPDLRDWLRAPMIALGWLAPLDAMSGSLADLRGIRRLVEAECAA
jgi:hypothetical protein